MRSSMYISKERKLALTAAGGHYHKFANCVNALLSRGYSQEEMMDAIGQVSTQEDLWDEIKAGLGKRKDREDPAWKRFEKLSLGVHLLLQEGAIIRHNDEI